MKTTARPALPIWLIAALILLVTACNSGSTSSAADAADSTTPADSENADIDVVGIPTFPEIEVERTNVGDRLLLKPTDGCHRLESTPTAIGQWLLYSASPTGDCPSNDAELWGLDLSTQTLFRVASLSSIGTPLVWPTEGVFGALSNGGLFRLDADSLLPTETTQPNGSSITTSPLRLDQRLYLGTRHRSATSCSEAGLDCGAVLGLSLDGAIVAQLTVDRGFEASVTASPTSDGERIFLGTGLGAPGSTGFTHACAVVRLDRTLSVTARFDPGDSGCRENSGRHDFVSGEVVVGRSAVWALFADAIDSGGDGALVQLDFDLVERCRTPLTPPSDGALVGPTQGVVLDEQGRAYLAVNEGTAPAVSGRLLRVDSDCSSKTLLQLTTPIRSTPILVDDRFVMVAAGDTLYVVDRQNGETHTFPLAGGSDVIASPVVIAGTLVVAQVDGPLTIWPQSGFGSYGTALWPRPRRDNDGVAIEVTPNP
ncbi:MAG: hypothetical protein KC609_19485 [Myxococcales bacterium]|nr:hypothetical protein [Myxococcales bacterium]